MKSSYSVGQINSYIKNMFAQDYLLRSVCVKGEVSNVKYHSSGHIYFTMKDNTGTLACVMFAGARKGLTFRLQEGQQILTQGKIEIYERDGKYQLYAYNITLDGEGLLYEKYERLKRELEERGMFDSSYKQPVPTYIRTLGVVTAPTGAAVQDIINITKRRNPYVQIILYPAKVQGEGAKESIVAGISALEQLKVDVIIVGRGGGSIEDLWAFNEEEVAEAIFNCSVPIISAVGHETDTTIADFVADHRAPTPSAGAEIAVYDITQLDAYIQEKEIRYKRAINSRVERERLKYEKLLASLRGLSPDRRIREKRMELVSIQDKLVELMKSSILRRRHELELKIEKMKAVSPLDRLNSGYAFVENAQDKPVKSIMDVELNDELKLSLRDGSLKVNVLSREMAR